MNGEITKEIEAGLKLIAAIGVEVRKHFPDHTYTPGEQLALTEIAIQAMTFNKLRDINVADTVTITGSNKFESQEV